MRVSRRSTATPPGAVAEPAAIGAPRGRAVAPAGPRRHRCPHPRPPRRAGPAGRGGRAGGCHVAGQPDADTAAARTRSPVSGRPVRAVRLPGRLLTRAWDRGARPGARGLRRRPLGLAGRARAAAVQPEPAGRHRPRRRLAPPSRGHHAAWRAVARGSAGPGACPRGVDRRRRPASSPADLEAMGVEPARVTVVPAGADHLPAPDPVATDALLRRVAVAGEFLLTVGTLEPRKNLDRLVQAFGRVQPSLPAPWHLVVVGPAGWGQRPASRRARRHRLHRRRFRSGPGRALPAGPGLRLRAADRGLRVAASRGHADGDAGGGGRGGAQRARPRFVGSGPGPNRRPTRRRRHRGRALADVLTDESTRADLSGRGAAFARERTWRAARAGRTSHSGGRSDDGPARPRARRLGGPGAGRPVRATTSWRWPTASRCATTSS